MPSLRAAPWLLAAVLASLPGPAAAQDGGVEWAPDLRKAFDVAKERGHGVLVWCNTDGEEQNRVDQQCMSNPQVLKAMKGFLVVYGNNADQHGSRDGTIDGKPAKVCKLAPGITCADHKRIIDQVFSTYGDVCVDRTSNLKMPVHFVVDPDGKVVAQINSGTVAAGFDAVPPAQLAKGFADALAKVGGPGLTADDVERLRKALMAARTSFEGGRASEAAKTLLPLSTLKKKIALAQDARELLARIDREAAPKVAEGKSRLGESPLAALALLDGVAEDYPGTDSAEEARKIAAAFRESPEGKKAVKDMAREKEGRAELAKAAEVADGRKDDARALRMLDAVARKYDGLPVAAAAREKADAIRNDAERARALAAVEAERAARSALTQARGLLDAGKKEEAREALRTVVQKHAGTQAAAEAAKLLEGLR
jgi:hypothetical protein